MEAPAFGWDTGIANATPVDDSRREPHIGEMKFRNVISFGGNLLQKSLISGSRLAVTRPKLGCMLFSQHG